MSQQAAEPSKLTLCSAASTKATLCFSNPAIHSCLRTFKHAFPLPTACPSWAMYKPVAKSKEGEGTERKGCRRQQETRGCSGNGIIYQEITQPMRPFGGLAGTISFWTMK